MSTSWTLATLEAAVKAWVEDSYTDFDAEFPNLLALAEDDTLKALNLSIFDSEQPITLTQGSPAVTKPANTLFTRELYYVTAGTNRAYLDLKTKTYLRDYWPDPAVEDAPLYWAEDDEDAYIIAPTPDANYSGFASVHVRPNSLNVDTGGTWLSQNVGDLLFAACMVQAHRFNIALTESKDWEGNFQSLLLKTKFELRHMIRNDFAPIPGMPTPKGEK